MKPDYAKDNCCDEGARLESLADRAVPELLTRKIRQIVSLEMDITKEKVGKQLETICKSVIGEVVEMFKRDAAQGHPTSPEQNGRNTDDEGGEDDDFAISTDSPNETIHGSSSAKGIELIGDDPQQGLPTVDLGRLRNIDFNQKVSYLDGYGNLDWNGGGALDLDQYE